jgi:hypothetical protein
MENNLNSYDTLSEGMEALKKQGFSQDFNLKSDAIECKTLDIELSPEEFEVCEFHRFEGASNPADNSILFAVESKDKSVKGLLVDAYGAYSNPLSQQMIDKLNVK